MPITDANVRAVRTEIDRLEARFREWERTTVSPQEREHGLVSWSAASGAVRRASMDLTRALADLRRVG